MEHLSDFQIVMKGAAKDATIMLSKESTLINVCAFMRKSPQSWKQEGIDAWEQLYIQLVSPANFAPR